jgi:hypothetical protein
MMLISGIFLNVSFFYNSTIASIFAFFSIAPALYALAKLENTKRYLG